MPPQAPASLTRAERFDGIVRDEVRRLEQHWGRELAQVEFAVEDVPDLPEDFDGPVPLGQTAPGTNGRPVRIVIFRRPTEARGSGERELSLLVRDLLVKEIADLLGLSPESVDPSYDSPDD